MALTFLNYRLHPKEWAWILANAEASVLIVERSFLDQIRPVLGEAPSLQHLVVIDGGGGEGTVDYQDLVERRPGHEAAGRGRRGQHGLVDLHQRHHGLPQGRHAHPPQPDHGRDRVGRRVPADARRTELARLPAVPRLGLLGARQPPPRRPGRAHAGLRARAVHGPRGAAPHHRHRPGPDDAQLPAAAPEDRRVRPLDAAQHRLRRGGHAGGGAEGGHPALRPHRLLRVRHDRAGRQRPHVHQGRPHPRRRGRGAPAGVVWRADVPGERARGRRPAPGVPARRGRRDRDPGRPGAEGLLAQRGGHQGRLRRRLVPHRRHGQARRGGLLLHRRSQEGHDPHGRRERVLPGGRGGHLHPPGGVGGGRDRPARRDLGRERHGSGGAAPGDDGDGGRDRRPSVAIGSPATRSRSRCSSSTSCPRTSAARSSSASCATSSPEPSGRGRRWI